LSSSHPLPTQIRFTISGVLQLCVCMHAYDTLYVLYTYTGKRKRCPAFAALAAFHDNTLYTFRFSTPCQCLTNHQVHKTPSHTMSYVVGLLYSTYIV